MAGPKKSLGQHWLKDRDVLAGIAAEAGIADPETVLEIGDTWRNKPLEPHQLICVREGTIIEVSTADSVEDNYRVCPGDSQKS